MSQPTLQRYWPFLALLLVAGLLALCFTLETRTEDKGYGHEAQLNPWLAAGRLLERQELRVRFAPRYHRLPAQANVIVLATPPDTLGQQEQAELVDWVQEGGHLVVEPSSADSAKEAESIPEESRELLHRHLDVRLQKREAKNDADNLLRRIAGLSDAHGLRTTEIDKEGHLKAGFNPRLFLRAGQYPPAWVVTDEGGAHAMRFAYGEGFITVLSDSQWLHNRMLERGDHGALLWRIVNADKGSEVWLVHGQDRPSLFSLLWQNALPLLLAVAVFVGLWLWQASRRFGPVHALPADTRRRLSEHLEASGRFLFRQQALASLFEASRERWLAQLQRQHPQWRRLSPEKQAAHLAERSGIEAGAILRLLADPPPAHILQFAADIRLINRLRRVS